MCELCDNSPDGSVSCQDCGCLICFETEAEDDVCAPAAVTASSDLYCRSCARAHDRAEEEADLEAWDYDPWYDYPYE
jgi:hypothetical protein